MNFWSYKFHTIIMVFRWNHFSETMFLRKKKLFFSDKEKIFFLSLSKKRKKEFLGIRYVLRYVGIKMNISYNEKRKPFIFDTGNTGKHISLSHSFERVAIAISSYHIGIDIEKLREDKKIVKIKKKFIRDDESIFIHPNYEEDYLHIIWGIKESLYKLEGGVFYSFLNHYKVSPFCIQKDSYISCWIIKDSYSKRFYAYYRKIEKHYLVYIIDK
ncbi:4'-phosphopantetheinyl transferase family protein [Blattabacterium cuenoti]|uniref:4'-phosphopantetheinyl transferase family protein n=1 Tax=Blattabacterium cuenoti TaxID=1653831 RepID=UPI00163BFFB3|nr:4'-phosphopantetheinyl transferase superfamily protein [Blattabacterium cuenoti]